MNRELMFTEEHFYLTFFKLHSCYENFYKNLSSRLFAAVCASLLHLIFPISSLTLLFSTIIIIVIPVRAMCERKLNANTLRSIQFKIKQLVGEIFFLLPLAV